MVITVSLYIVVITDRGSGRRAGEHALTYTRKCTSGVVSDAPPGTYIMNKEISSVDRIHVRWVRLM